MKSLFDETTYKEIIERLSKLKEETPRKWGKMNATAMVKHCNLVLSSSLGTAPRKRALMSYLFRKMAKKQYVYRSVYKKNGYTAPSFIVTNTNEHSSEMTRLIQSIDQFRKAGEQVYENRLHAFFGRLTAQEWGMLQYNHLNHHLTQFGV